MTQSTMKRHWIRLDTSLTVFSILIIGMVCEARSQGYAPEQAVKEMTVAEGFEIELVASEPLVRQPVAIEFDDRGRLWVIQYLQYPNPAGLKRVKVDRFSRTTYDRVPLPPPHGPRGADRITILEDTDGDGKMDRGKDFVDGLNLASGIAFGNGGVYVLNVPYLLFYPDQNRDDIPDGDPEVLLSGFGMEDSSALANSLTWGPDGWLYGNQGTTVTANIRGIEFQQGVWRYHPTTKQFELFCEGGPNMYGLDYDRKGNIFTSNTFGNPVMMHALPGAYYVKAFGKHGPLHNPYAFGYFDLVPHEYVRGTHVTSSGIVYRGDTFPENLRGSYIGLNLLSHEVYYHQIIPNGSTFRTKHAGELLAANDTWFAAVDIVLGPDGAVYIADWHDKRTAHPDPDADWDLRNGRIFRLQAKGKPRIPEMDLQELSSAALVEMLTHPNDWFARKARRILMERKDTQTISTLRNLVLESEDDQETLYAMWTLFGCGGFDDQIALAMLSHDDEEVRSWAVRFIGEGKDPSDKIVDRLVDLAGDEKCVRVRSQIASTIQRLPTEPAIKIYSRLLRHFEDLNDPYMPLLLWWALERHAENRDQVLELTKSDVFWTSTPIVRLIARRYATAGKALDWMACATLLKRAPNNEALAIVLTGIKEGLEGRHYPEMPEPIRPTLERMWERGVPDDTLLAICIRLGNKQSIGFAIDSALKNDLAPSALCDRIALITDVCRSPDWRNALIEILKNSGDASVKLAVLTALGRFADSDLADVFLTEYQICNKEQKDRILSIMVSRQNWAEALVGAVDNGIVQKEEVSIEQVRQIAAYESTNLKQKLITHWGQYAPRSSEEKLATVRRLNNDLNAAVGNPEQGMALFKKHCAVCHKLFGEGNEVGPDLTGANRQDRSFLLLSLVDPSSRIETEYVTFVVLLVDGRSITGRIVQEDPGTLVVLDSQNNRMEIARSDIEEIFTSSLSMMPDNIWEEFSPQQLRDLFSYLQSNGK